MVFGLGKPNIEKLEKKRDINGLVKALNYEKDEDIRGNAAYALGVIGDVQAVEPLILALKDEHPYVRAYAAQALGMIGDARSVKPLINTLTDYFSDVRISCL